MTREAPIRAQRLVATLIVGVLVLMLVVSMVAPAFAQERPVTDWTIRDAAEQVRTADVAALPGAAAVVDPEAFRAAVRAAAPDEPIKVLAVPFSPIDEREEYGARVNDLQDLVEDEQGVQLIVLSGLTVSMPFFQLVPSDLAELRPVLQSFDVTGLVVGAVHYMVTEELLDDPPPPTALPSAAGPAEVAEIAAALREDPTLYLDGAEPAGDPQAAWREHVTDLPLRLVVTPPVPAGDPVAVEAAQLTGEFPGEVVVVLGGRWFDVAGPEQHVLDTAVAAGYGYGATGFLGWDVGPAGSLRVLAQRLAELRSGAVTDQPAPAEVDPVGVVVAALPWIAAVTVLGAAVVLVRRNAAPSDDAGDRRHAVAVTRAETAARLPDLAARILDLDPRVRSGSTRAHLSIATERYGRARDLIAAGGDPAEAHRAADQAAGSLDRVEELLVGAR